MSNLCKITEYISNLELGVASNESSIDTKNESIE